MDKPINILIIGVAWPMETFLQRLVKGLLDQGLRVAIATVNRPESSWFEKPGFSWLPALGGKSIGWKRIISVLGKLLKAFILYHNDLRTINSSLPPLREFYAWFTAVERVLPYLGQRWDVIYFPWNSSAIDHLPLFKLGMPIVISCRGSQILIAPHNPRREDYYERLRESLAQAAKIHCVSSEIMKVVLGFGVNPSKMSVIYPAVDPWIFQNKENGEEISGSASHFRVISVGALAWVKGYEYSLQAIALLKAQGIPVQYEIIGTGADRNRVIYTIHDLGIEDCVTLSGQLPPEDIAQHLHQSDAFLLSSLSEGISNAVLEAMACGLPIVTSDCGGMREAVTNGIEGFVTPMFDSTAMAGELFRLYENPHLRFSMGQAGRRKVLEQHNLRDQISSFIELFHEAVEHG